MSRGRKPRAEKAANGELPYNFNAVFTAHGSDKGRHNYGPFYREIVATMPKHGGLLEVGVNYGGSVRAWAELLPDRPRFYVDIDPQYAHNVQAPDKLYLGDANNGQAIAEMLGDTKLALAIDDGSHINEHQKNFFYNLWPHIVPGGWLVIEDTHTSYAQWAQAPGKKSLLEWAFEMVHIMNHKGQVEFYQFNELGIGQVRLEKSIIAFQKALP